MRVDGGGLWAGEVEGSGVPVVVRLGGGVEVSLGS